LKLLFPAEIAFFVQEKQRERTHIALLAVPQIESDIDAGGLS
jgi:hypothetical protein